jgi:putative proteasome-type protease
MYKKDALVVERHYRFGPDHPYLLQIRQQWASQLYNAFRAMPPLPIAN